MDRAPVDDVFSDTDSESDVASHLSAQAGVKRLEATAALWSKWSLVFAYGGYVCFWRMLMCKCG
jgi:hypothetical protein